MFNYSTRTKMKFFSMLLPSGTRILNQNNKTVSQRNYCQSDEPKCLETSFELLELEDSLPGDQLIKDYQPTSRPSLIDSYDSGFSFEHTYSPGKTKFTRSTQFTSSGESLSNQLYKGKTIRKRSHRTVRRQFKLDSLNCSFENSLDLNTIPSVDSKLGTDNSLEFNESDELKSNLNSNEDGSKRSDSSVNLNPSAANKNDDNLNLNKKSSNYLMSKNDFKKKSSSDLDQTDQPKESKKKKKKKFLNKNSFDKQLSSSVISTPKNHDKSNLKSISSSISLDEQDRSKSPNTTAKFINSLKNQMFDLMNKTSFDESYNRTNLKDNLVDNLDNSINRSSKKLDDSKEHLIRKSDDNLNAPIKLDKFNDKKTKSNNQNKKSLKFTKSQSKDTPTVTTKTVSTFKKAYLRTAQAALESSSYNVWNNKKQNRTLNYHHNGSMFNLNTFGTNQHQKKQPNMFNPIKFKSQKCRIKAFQAYRSKSLTQIDCLDDHQETRKEDKPGTSSKETHHHHHHSATSSIHLSPQHSQQHYLQCTSDNLDQQQFLANQTHCDYQYTSHSKHSQPESSLESSEFSGNLTSGGHAQLNENSLIVPNLNQITSSTTSSSKDTSKDNDDHHFPIKTIVHRGNSTETAVEEHQQPLRKQQSFNQHKRRGEPVMVSCENLLDDNIHQYKAYTGKTHHHHVTRKTGSIFSNPFKNEKEKMEQLTELLNYYSTNGIPNCSNYETRKKSISKQRQQHSQQQQQVKTHHSTGSISSLSTVLADRTASSNATANQSTGHSIHSLGASFSSATGNVPLHSAIAVAAAAGGIGIGLPSSITSSINQSAGSTKHKNTHAPLRNSKSTSSSLMTSQTTGSTQISVFDAAQSIKEDPVLLGSGSYQEQSTAEKQKSFKNQMKILKQSSLEHSVYDEDMYLENDWSSIVKNQNELSKKLHNQQDAIWELVTTEVSYISKLKVITNLFRDCLLSLQNECLLNDIDCDKIFSNIDEVISANLNFWKSHLLIMLNHTRYTGEPLNPLLMAKGFFQFDEIFAPYRTYCVEHLVSLQYVKKKQKENELFKTYIAWCETRKDCERLHMVDLLVNPMQRLTKYSLLLKVIQTKTEDEDQLKALKQMNQNVERFVVSVDSSLSKRNQLEKLHLISRRIESYDAIESNNDEVDKIIKEYRELNLMQPMIGCEKDEVRQLLLEASGLKLKDSYNSSKTDVHCLLFTDLLLVCKQINKRTSDRLKIIRQPFFINRLRTHELKDQSGLVMIYLNELNVASTFFTLYTSDTRIWLQKLKEAKKLLKNLQQKFKDKEKYEQFLKNKPSLQIMKSTEDEYFEDYYDLSGAIQTSNLQQPLYLQQQQLLLSSQFSSSRSSLIKSQSNSIDQSEASAFGSNLILAAPTSTPNPLLNSCCSNCGQQLNLQQALFKQSPANTNQTTAHKQPDQQSSFTSTTLGSISLSTLESCSICNLSNMFINPTNAATISNSNLLMTGGHSSNSATVKLVPSNKKNQVITTAQLQQHNQQNLNPNQIHSKYLLSANMNLLPVDNNQQRAISFELGELRNPSITVDDLDCLGRSQSMENRNSPCLSLRPERRAFLLKGSGRPANMTSAASGVQTLDSQLSKTYTNANPHLIAAFPSSNSASIDSTTCSHQHYCSQCNNRISLSSSDTNNYNVVIAAGGLVDQQSLNRSTTQSNSSLQPTLTHTQAANSGHLRQVKSLEKEYNPSICEEQFVLPVPNIGKIYGRSLDEILDPKAKQEQNLKDEKSTNLNKATADVVIITEATNSKKATITSTNSPVNKPPLIKMKNVIMNSAVSTTLPAGTASQVTQVKSAPNSGESSPKNNLSFDSDIGDLAISDPGDYYYHQSSVQENQENSKTVKETSTRRPSISKLYFLAIDNPSIKSSTSLDEMDLNEQSKGEYKVTNIPSFLISIENQEEERADDEKDKNDLNNNLV